jgi:hypothetical protein
MYSHKNIIDDSPNDDFDKKLDEILEKYLY